MDITLNNLLVKITPLTGNIATYIFGFAAILFAFISYFAKRKIVLMTFLTCNCLCLSISYLLQGYISEGMGTFIATARMLTFSILTIKHREIKWWIVGIIILAMAVNFAITFELSNLESIVYFIGLIVYTLSFKSKQYKYVKFWLLIANTIYIIWCLIIEEISLMNMLAIFTEAISALIGFVFVKGKEEKNY